jgi:hypothetical protein
MTQRGMTMLRQRLHQVLDRGPQAPWCDLEISRPSQVAI